MITDIAKKYVVHRIGISLGWFALISHPFSVNILDAEIVMIEGCEGHKMVKYTMFKICQLERCGEPFQCPRAR